MCALTKKLTASALFAQNVSAVSVKNFKIDGASVNFNANFLKFDSNDIPYKLVLYCLALKLTANIGLYIFL